MKTLFFCPSCGTSNDFSQVKNLDNLIICYECKHTIGSLNELNGVPTKIVPPYSTSPRYTALRIISWVYIATGVLIALLYILSLLTHSSSSYGSNSDYKFLEFFQEYMKLFQFLMIALFVVAFVAVSEGIRAFLAIEENTRITSEELKKFNQKNQ
jgi:hypothetical protein